MGNFSTDVRTTLLLVKDTTRFDHFKFSHKSYLEYLVAENYLAGFGIDSDCKKLMSDGVIRALPSEYEMNEESVQYFTQQMTWILREPPDNIEEPGHRGIGCALYKNSVRKASRWSTFTLNCTFMLISLRSIRRMILDSDEWVPGIGWARGSGRDADAKLSHRSI